MDKESLEVVEHIVAYFKEHRPDYMVMGVGRKSLHPDEAHLYMVLSKKDGGSYGFYGCWDESRRVLNHSCFGIEFLDSFVARRYAVYSCTDRDKDLLFITDDEERARRFCEDHGWKLKDENGDACRLIYEVTG